MEHQDVRLRNGRSERIRTSDPIVPNDVRYQAALHSDMAVQSGQSGYIRGTAAAQALPRPWRSACGKLARRFPALFHPDRRLLLGRP